MSLPTVFEPGRRPWIDATRASADAIARVVAHCPTGALHCERTDGGLAETTPPANTALVTRHGPVYLHGDIEVLDESGALRLADTRVALCRCGGSANKPLCDGTHVAAGFRDVGAVSAENGVKDSNVRDGKLRVRPEPNGPLQLEGPFALASADRRTMLAGSSARLCRCGHSQTKPFCDGSHKRVEFVSR
jgi:CDGSH-type Zn-finger protein